MIRLCAICGEPIYSWDKAWSNEEGLAVHAACFGALMYQLHAGMFQVARHGNNRPSGFGFAFHLAFTMKGEKMNEWCWQRHRELGLQPRLG